MNPFIVLKITSALIFSTFLALPVHAGPNKKKKGDSPKEPRAKNQIEFVTQVGADMNDSVLLPLERNYRQDVRPSLVRLRDSLLDEAKDNPVASPATYNTAVRLVNAWLSALQERETRRASLGMTAPPTTDLTHGKKTTLHYPDDILTFRREVKDAAAYRATEKQKKEFFKDAEKNSWRLRTEALRSDLENLYSQFRALRRQST